MNTFTVSTPEPSPLSLNEWLKGSEAQRAYHTYQRTVTANPFIPHKPHPRQQEFLLDVDAQEILFGGSAGGGKSDALLMAALQFVDVPGYAALLLRRTFRDLNQPDALIPRSKEWLSGKAEWNGLDKRWTFPSGATLTFGYLDHADDVYQYQGAAYAFVGYDELTQFEESQYRYLFSRLRRRTNAPVPLRMRAGSNPGGVGHDWVKRRFIDENGRDGRTFIPSRLEDNPSLDQAEYIASLAQLDPITRAQLLSGDWTVRQGGGFFKRTWFRIVDVAPGNLSLVRAWDLAATAPKPGRDPDYTVGVLMGRSESGDYYVLDVLRDRLTPQGVEALVRQAAAVDGSAVAVVMEQEAGASGVALIDHYGRRVLANRSFHAVRPTGDKVARAAPLSSHAEAGRVFLVRGAWIGEFLDELEAFPQAAHDDQVDAAAHAQGWLTSGQTDWEFGAASPEEGSLLHNIPDGVFLN